MATVIDSLIVALSLDPKEFTKGQKAAAAEMLKARRAAEQNAKAIEKSMDSAAEAVDRLARNALKLFAIFTAGRAIKDFVADVTSADAAMGRLAKSIGSTPEAISSLANAVARNGGSASAAAGSFERLSDSINELKTTGNSSILPVFGRLQGISGRQIRLNTDLATTFGDIAEAAKVSAEKVGVSQTSYLLKQAGYDQGTIALLIQGRAKLNEALEKSRKIGIVNEKDTKAAQALETSIESLRQTSESFGRSILTALTPTITDLLERMQRWVETNKEWIQTEIVARIREFAEYLKSIDWNRVGDGIKAFAAGAKIAVDAVGGWVKAIEILFGLWLGTQFLKVMANIALMRAALVTGNTSLLAALLRVAAPVAIGVAATGHGFQTPEEYDAAKKADPGEKRFADERIGQRERVRNWFGRQWNRAKRLFGGGAAEAHTNGGNLPSGSGAGNLTALTEMEARRTGIDPRIMHGIRAGESLHADRYDVKSDSKEDSYGPFQLNRRGGLGAEFEKETGLDLHDPKTIPAQVRWVAEHIKKRQAANPNYNPGTEWFGYKGLQNADPSWRDSGYVPTQAAGNVPPVNGVGGLDQAQGGATRSQPLSTMLKAQIVAAATAAGVNAEVYSGGQDESGPNRTGSHRHDHGNAADLKLYTVGQDGKRRYLDMTNDADRVVMEKFVRESVKNGVNGVGAGPGYMGGTTNMHVGGGSPLAWGAGGASANAPEWLQRAHREGLADRAQAARPVSQPSAARQARQAGAQAAIAQAQAAQAAMVSSTSNDNRSSTDNSSQWHIENLNLQTSATDGRAAAHDFRDTLSSRAFAAAANRGLA